MAMSVASCVAQTPATPAALGAGPQLSSEDAPVVVVFDSNNCPVGVVPAEVDFDRSVRKRVVWTAVDQSGAGLDNVEFNIWFDPFVGGKPIEKKAGKTYVASPNIETDAPASAEGVQYKYTIISVTGPSCAPLDPMIRLR
jgi:hypothetical protein